MTTDIVYLDEYRRKKQKEEIDELHELVQDILLEAPPEIRPFYLKLEEMLSLSEIEDFDNER